MGQVSDEEIATAFAYSWGGQDHRIILKQAVLKHAAGRYNPHTLNMVMEDLKLIANTNAATLSKKGQQFLLDSFYDTKLAI